MAQVTTIGAYNADQIDYRLGGQCGCDERQFDYHAEGAERPLRWIGGGLAEVGIEAGTELATPADFAAARALMAGADPRTGEQLVSPKLAVYEDAKVPLAPLVAQVHAAWQQTGTSADEVFSGKPLRAWRSAERAVQRLGEAATLRADDAGRLADAARVQVEDVWGAEVYEQAVEALNERTIEWDEHDVPREVLSPRRRPVGNAGYDVTLTLPKSMSLLFAFADRDRAGEIEACYTDTVNTAFGWLEAETAYGMRGKHGGGKSATVTPGSGFLGWAMVHRSARPVEDREVGDPHWHVHVTVANMTRSVEDGRWSTVAAGGRDLMRHAPALGRVFRAITRHQLHEQLGVRFVQHDTAAGRGEPWEVAGISRAAIEHFSRRGTSIHELLEELGLDEAQRGPACERIAEAQSRGAKTETTGADDDTLRTIWWRDAAEAGLDVAGDVRGALAAAAPGDLDDPDRRAALVDRLATTLSDPQTGLTAHSRRFSTLDALGAVADELAYGAASIEELEQLTSEVLERPQFCDLAESAMPARGMDHAHLAGARMYTTGDVVAAERAVFARAGSDERVAAVEADRVADAISMTEAAQGYQLSDDQRAAVAAVAMSDRAVDTIVGPPGTGKTTLMRAARLAWELDGYRVAGAATAAVAAQNVQNEAGITSHTVASWLTAPERLGEVDVLVLDEANLTDDRARAQLYAAAAEHGVKVVEVGDPRQLRGVGCGSVFGVLTEATRGAELTTSRRQEDVLERAALAQWRAGDYTGAWQSWAGRGRLVATETAQEALGAMVAEGLRLRGAAPTPYDAAEGVVMIAGTNAEVATINDLTQQLRVDAGEIGTPVSYAGRNNTTISLAPGDLVMARINSRAERLHHGEDVLNGYRGVVTAADPGGVTVAWRAEGDDGPQEHTAYLPAGYIAAGGVELGYAITAHKAEGLTVAGDWTTPDGEQVRGTVLADLHGMDNPAAYVSASRHRGKFVGYAAREVVESQAAADKHGTPAGQMARLARVSAALAEHATRTEDNRNDAPATQVPAPDASRASAAARLEALRDAMRRGDAAAHTQQPEHDDPSGPPDPAPAWIHDATDRDQGEEHER